MCHEELAQARGGMVGVNLSRMQRFLIGGAIAVCVIAIVVSLIARGNSVDEVTMHNTRPYQAPGAEPGAEATYVTVHVVGEVARPGVYRVKAGSRVYDVIAAAGGFTSQADRQSVNLASFVSDGQQIEVPTGSGQRSGGSISQPYKTIQPQKWPAGRARPAAGDGTGQTGGAGRRPAPAQPARGGSAGASDRSGRAGQYGSGQDRLGSSHTEQRTTAPRRRINVNTASQAELEKLPGIGSELSSRIIQYRARHGPFRNSTDLTKVKGIGDKTAADIAPHITF